ncbi:hypothetical protein DFH07DRAFT_693609, partial [Mycena maculata]
SYLVLRPSNVTPVEAASLDLVVSTVIQGIKDLNVESGQTVLINDGSSAAGLAAIQIAKS